MLKKFSEYIDSDLLKLGEIVEPIDNYHCWPMTDLSNAVILDKQTELYDFDGSFNGDYIITPDSLIGKIHIGYEVLTKPILAKVRNEIIPIATIRSKETNTLYLADVRYLRKKSHKFCKPYLSYYLVNDNSWCHPVKINTYFNNIEIGKSFLLLEPKFIAEENKSKIFLDDNFLDSYTTFIIVSYNYMRNVKILNHEKWYSFVNVFSPITHNIYSVLYNKNNEVA